MSRNIIPLANSLVKIDLLNDESHVTQLNLIYIYIYIYIRIGINRITHAKHYYHQVLFVRAKFSRAIVIPHEKLENRQDFNLYLSWLTTILRVNIIS